jgi:cytochrome c oxidase subunit II
VLRLRHSRWLYALTALVIAVAIVLLVIFALPPLPSVLGPERGPTPNAQATAELYKLLFALALVVFIGVEFCLIWFVIRFRARKGQIAAQIHGNTQLEVGWTAGAALLLVFITAVTFVKLGQIKNPAPSTIDANGTPVNIRSSTYNGSPPAGNALTLQVEGQQYIWRYTYPGSDGVFAYQEMVVPVGMTVKLNIDSDDVAHSWWVPALGGKFDAIPGYTNHTWFRIDKPGLFKGQCAELCGREHANMLAQVRALPFDQYQTWYKQQANNIRVAKQLAAQERQQFNAQS